MTSSLPHHTCINTIYTCNSFSFWGRHKIIGLFSLPCVWKHGSLTLTMAGEQMRDYSGGVRCLSCNEVPHTPFWVNVGDSGSLSWSQNSSLSAQQGGSGLLALSQSMLGPMRRASEEHSAGPSGASQVCSLYLTHPWHLCKPSAT